MNLPTKITFARIIAIILMIITLFVLASYTDYLDGHLARKNNQVTDLGKFLDPVADKLLINSIVIFLVAPSVFAPYVPWELHQVSFSVWCAILLVARDIVVDALRFIAANKGKVIAANIFGKLKTVLEMVAIGVVLLNGFPFRYFDASWPAGLHISDFFVYLATAASLFSGFIYVYKNRDVFKSEEK